MIDDLRGRALHLGFDLCGVAPVERVAGLEALRDWVARGFAGDLHYVTRSVEERLDPTRVFPGARSAIVLGTVYNTDAPRSLSRTEPGVARIARYAWGEDYHEVLGRRMHLLIGWLREQVHGRGLDPGPEGRFDAVAYVDTGPIQEKALAAAAGLGWIGKHTCLINQELGSWLFLSVILTTLDLPHGQPVPDRCGTCTRCLDICPTGAIVEPYLVDARKCLAYVTIESHAGVDEAARGRVGSQVYGCDLCQDVCPWNGDAAVTDDPVWVARALWREATLAELWRAPDETLQENIRRSTMYRTRVWRIRRNLALAIAATGDADACAALDEPRDPAVDPSFAHPVVIEHIEWARAAMRRRRASTS